MLISEPFTASYQKKAAKLYVLRNNGYCWGRLVLANGKQFDVVTRKDWYDRPDAEAAAAFRKAIERGQLEPISRVQGALI